jgi:hypothetical protein
MLAMRKGMGRANSRLLWMDRTARETFVALGLRLFRRRVTSAAQRVGGTATTFGSLVGTVSRLSLRRH